MFRPRLLAGVALSGIIFWAAAAYAAPTVDLDGDGKLTITDVQCSILLVIWTLAGEAPGAEPGCLGISLADADVNGDGARNVVDVLIVIQSVLQGYGPGFPSGPPKVSVPQIQGGAVAEGTLVALEGVVVTGVAKLANGTGYGLFVADPAGGPLSGAWVYTKQGSEALARGQLVDLTGIVREYDAGGTWEASVTEVDVWDTGTNAAVGTVDVKGAASEPAPVVISAALFASAATIEPYEGVLVTVKDLTVDNADLGFGEWSASGVRFDDKLYNPGKFKVGDKFAAITGVVDYTHNTYKVLPRDAKDIAQYAPGVLAMSALNSGALVLSEVMIDPGLECADASDEYVEFYNASGQTVDLKGLVVQWGTSTNTIAQSVLIPAGAYALGIRKEPSPCYQHTGHFTITLSLTNSGGVLSLKRPDGAVIDQADFSGWSNITSGQSLGLDPKKLDAVQNDAKASWCLQTASVKGDFGTPAMPNTGCPASALNAGYCFTNANCTPPAVCWGIPYDGSTTLGKCVNPNANFPGAYADCTSDQSCATGLLCAGLTLWDTGLCLPKWMAGTYWNQNDVALPGGTSGTSSSVAAFGLATVPIDVVVTLALDHPRPSDLAVTLMDPNGCVAKVWAPGEGQAGVYTGSAIGISGDDTVNGLWTLSFTDVGTGSGGILRGFHLYLTSNFD